MADALDPDPHGTRGSTVHHALDYKKEVKKFSSADILASFHAAQRGEVVPVKALDGAASASSSSRRLPPDHLPLAAAPPTDDGNVQILVRGREEKPAEELPGRHGAKAGAQAVEQARAVQAKGALMDRRAQ